MPAKKARKGGVRIVHADADLAGKIVVIPTFRYYGVPRMCTLCQRAHEVKHYHLRLDGQASVIVTDEILDRLREIGQIADGRFAVDGKVKDPPRQRLVGAGRGQPDRRELALLSDALRGITPPGAKVKITNGSHG